MTMKMASGLAKGLKPAAPSLWKIIPTVRPKKTTMPATVAMSMIPLKLFRLALVARDRIDGLSRGVHGLPVFQHFEDDLRRALPHEELVARGEVDRGLRAGLERLDELGVDHDLHAVELVQGDHGRSPGSCRERQSSSWAERSFARASASATIARASVSARSLAEAAAPPPSPPSHARRPGARTRSSASAGPAPAPGAGTRAISRPPPGRSGRSW